MSQKHQDFLFDHWSRLKKKLHHGAGCPYVSEGEIWWCGVGQNIGVEINGKHSVFSRPVLVLTKLSRFCFLAVPLSTRQKQGSWYVAFRFQNRSEIAVLSQIKVMSVHRLYSRMGRIDEMDLDKIKTAFRQLYP